MGDRPEAYPTWEPVNLGGVMPNAISPPVAQLRADRADRLAPWMFTAAATFLFMQAVLVVLWADVPALRASVEAAIEAGDIDRGDFSLDANLGVLRAAEWIALGTMLLIWPVVAAEAIYHLWIRPKDRLHRRMHAVSLAVLICPSLRLCPRVAEQRRRVWLPGLGWRPPGRHLRRRLSRHFSGPMLGIALLILPVLVVEFLMKEQVARYTGLRVALHISTGVIWLAFAAEYIVMISVAEKKLDYMRRHWLDLAIILLPFFAFLRSLQALRGTRVAQLAKLPMLTKLVRAYRLRGTAIKAFRALLLLEAVQRWLTINPDRSLRRTEVALHAVRREERMLRLRIAGLRRQIAEEAFEQELERRRAKRLADRIALGDGPVVADGVKRQSSRPPTPRPPETLTESVHSGESFETGRPIAG